MSLSITRNAGEYSPYDGSQIIVHEVKSDGSELTSPDTYHDLGILDETGAMDKTPVTDKYDSSNQVYGTEEGARDIAITGTFAQRSAAVLAIAKECRSKYYLLMKHNGQVNAKTQRIWAFGKITPQFDYKWKGGTTPFEFKAIKNNTAITIALATVTGALPNGFAATEVTTTVVIAAANASGSAGFYEITEV